MSWGQFSSGELTLKRGTVWCLLLGREVEDNKTASGERTRWTASSNLVIVWGLFHVIPILFINVAWFKDKELQGCVQKPFRIKSEVSLFIYILCHFVSRQTSLFGALAVYSSAAYFGSFAPIFKMLLQICICDWKMPSEAWCKRMM